MLSEKHWQWLGRIADAYAIYTLGIIAISALATWLAASSDTESLLAPWAWLATFFGGAGFLVLCLAIGLRIIASPHQPEIPKLVAETRQEYRQRLEESCVGAEGTPVTVALSDTMNLVRIAAKDQFYEVSISRNGGTRVWAYQRERAKKISIIPRTTKRGETIDTRKVRPFRYAGNITIGDRLIVEMDDGAIAQVLLTGVLSYDDGDDHDEARFRYKVYDEGDFLVPAL